LLDGSPPCRVECPSPQGVPCETAPLAERNKGDRYETWTMAAAVGRLGGVLPRGLLQGRSRPRPAGRTRNQPRPLRARRRPSGSPSSPRARRTSTGSPSTPAPARPPRSSRPTRTFRPSSSTGRARSSRTTRENQDQSRSRTFIQKLIVGVRMRRCRNRMITDTRNAGLLGGPGPGR